MATETIQCLDCNNDFYFTDRDQQFYAENGYSKPKRCKPCRDTRKAGKNSFQAQPQQAPSSNNPYEPGFFNDNDRPQQRRTYDNDRSRNNRGVVRGGRGGRRGLDDAY